VFGQERREANRFEHASNEVRRSIFEMCSLAAMIGPGLEIAHAALFIGVLIGAYEAGINLPVLATFLVLLYRMQPFLRALEHAPTEIAACRGSVRQIEWLLDPTGKPTLPHGPVSFDGLKTAIVFDKVSFRYPHRPEQDRVLNEVSFRLAKGQSTALIGPSGSGKTTIINLLCRLLEPTAGRIMVDGVDLTTIDPQTWLSHVGLAGQDIDLIDGTIAENIAYGRPEAPIEEIMEAARLADVDTFVRQLPAAYSTRVGNRGLALSGGQRQRIGIARALLRKPQILIFDEATNAVDGVSEATILKILRHPDRTSIVISHRTSTTDWCDDGVVIDHGCIIEAGALTSLTAYLQMLQIHTNRRCDA
jgi:subfamily B ATP-binding cassette protein MsbA